MSRKHILAAAVLCASACRIEAQAGTWAGTWFSSRGTITFEQQGAVLTARYGENKQHRLVGKLEAGVLTAKFVEGAIAGDVRFERAPGAALLRGRLTVGVYREPWFAWQADPKALKGRPVKLGGVWRSSLGILELRQRGSQITGRLGPGGGHVVGGRIKGRRMELDCEMPIGKVSLWCEEHEAGAVYGALRIGSVERAFIARRAEGHVLRPYPKAGKLVRGVADNRLLYYLRAPASYKRGRPVPAIVFLHGKQSNSRTYIEQLAKDSDIGGRYLLIGIDGEIWNDKSEVGKPRNEYTFVEWMGKSVHSTPVQHQQQSPALIAELLELLKGQLKLERVFVGGHSQGGIVSYYMLMHFPELIDGVFPIAGAVTMQCQPGAFSSEVLRAAQRRVPLAIVHGRKDPAMLFKSCEESLFHFADAAFPSLRLFANDGGHGFKGLPFHEAIVWLEGMTSVEPESLLTFAIDFERTDDLSSLVAVLGRLEGLRLNRKQKTRMQGLDASVQRLANAEAEGLLQAIEQNTSGEWVDSFLAFRERFEFTPAAKKVLAAYQNLRDQHERPAALLVAEAFQCRQRGDVEGSKTALQRVLDEFYASSYRTLIKIRQ